MNARGLAIPVVLLLLTAGCLGGAQEQSSVETTPVTVSQGENTTITLTAQEVSQITVLFEPNTEETDTEGIRLDFDDSTATPPTESTYITKPLDYRWEWGTIQSNVVINIPLVTTENATPGEYTYTYSGDARIDSHVPAVYGNQTILVRKK